MNNTVQKISVTAGCTALSLGLGLLEANPADASLIGDEFDYVINVGQDGTSGSDIVEEGVAEIFFNLDGVLEAPDQGFSEGLIDLEESTISGLIFTDTFSTEFNVAHSFAFSNLNGLDGGVIVGAALTRFDPTVTSPLQSTNVSAPSLNFTEDSVTLLFNTEGFDPDLSNPLSTFEIDFEITLNVEQTIPEPSSFLSLAALGILGTGATLKRKSKSSKTVKDSLR